MTVNLAYPTGPDTALYSHAATLRWGWQPTVPPDGPRWLAGHVRLRAPDTWQTDYVPLVDPQHELLVLAEEVLQCWPAMYVQCQQLLDEIISGMFASRQITMPAGGGTCGPGDGWGKILVVSNNPVGYAEGVVHELGHHKLRALGIDMEEHNGALLRNTPEELYSSGVRKDKLRPMSAVLHAHYSYLHVTECELRAGVVKQYDIDQMLPYQVKRLSEGWAVIQQYAQWTEAGASFAAGIADWTRRLLEWMQQYQAGERTLPEGT